MPSILSVRSLTTIRQGDERAILLVLKVGGWGSEVREVIPVRSWPTARRRGTFAQRVDGSELEDRAVVVRCTETWSITCCKPFAVRRACR